MHGMNFIVVNTISLLLFLKILYNYICLIKINDL
nr:MAG TPA: hypothetical protein [Bacteriophage sp.]